MPVGAVHRGRAAPAFPEMVGAYELLLPIASGGMGTVYLARKRGPGGFEREVALKLTHSFLREQPEWTAELIEEAKLASRIHHPNVVQVLDVEDDAFGVFLVMQYIEGDTLHALRRHAAKEETRVPTDIALRILVDALAGLHAAHELRDAGGEPLGVVHRDFTPQNILVGTDGVARLTDFGVAKAASRVGVTRTGVVKGKAVYMAPEQVRAQQLDRRADVWAAGVIAWELFAGRRMHRVTDDPAAMLLQIATESPPRLRSARDDVPLAVDEAIAHALSVDRTRRCPSAQRFAELLVQGWASEAAPASAATVAQYVRGIVGDTLASRRLDAARVASERTAHGTDASLVTPALGRKARTTGLGQSPWAVALLVLAATGVIATAGLLVGRAGRLPVAARVAQPTPPHALRVAADAPVSEVRVDGNVIALASPAASLVVDVPIGALRPGAAIEAQSSDGRRTNALLGDDVTHVVLSFPPPVASAVTTETPTPSAAPSAALPPPGVVAPWRRTVRGVPRPAIPQTSPQPSAPTTAVTPLAKSPYE
jgi:hypothetical protein